MGGYEVRWSGMRKLGAQTADGRDKAGTLSYAPSRGTGHGLGGRQTVPTASGRTILFGEGRTFTVQYGTDV